MHQYIYQTLHMSKMRHIVHSLAEFNRFEFGDFLSPRQVVIVRLKSPILPYNLPISGGRIIRCNPIPRGISFLRYANCLLQDLNMCHCVHFL